MAHFDPKEGEKKGAPARAVLELSPSIAPYKTVVLPLDQRVNRDAKFADMIKVIRSTFGMQGMAFTIDDGGATVGRRYE